MEHNILKSCQPLYSLLTAICLEDNQDYSHTNPNFSLTYKLAFQASIHPFCIESFVLAGLGQIHLNNTPLAQNLGCELHYYHLYPCRL